MKTLTPLLLLAMLAFISCEKEESKDEDTTASTQTAITYPDSIFYGNNILSLPDSTVLTSNVNYEMGAVLEKDASLYLIITNYSDTTPTQPVWYISTALGWAVIAYHNLDGTQKFICAQTGKSTVRLIFYDYGHIGNCKIDFYENGNIITRTKHFSWQ